MNSVKTNENSANWTKYWESGSLTSCLFDNGTGNYKNAIGEFWKELSEQITEDSQIVDICTGNGAVVNILLGEQLKSNKAPSNYIGIDRADINPAWVEPLNGALKSKIELRGNSSVESLDIADSAVDVFTSQYGWEYAEHDLVLSEIKRTLKDGGEFWSIVHSTESLVYANSNIELEHLNWLHTESQLFDSAEELLPFFAQLANPANIARLQNDKDANNAKTSYNFQVSALSDKIASAAVPDVLAESMEACHVALETAREKGVTEAKKVMAAYRENLLSAESRLKDLVACSMTAKDLDELANNLQENFGAKVESKAIMNGKFSMGWGMKVKF